MEEKSRPHVAILSSPGMGHLIPLAEFAKQLVLYHNFSATVINLSTTSSSNPSKAILDSLPGNINSIQLPPPNLDDLPPTAKVETVICLTLTRSLSCLREVLKSLISTTRLVALVVDLFGCEAFDVARELGLPPYIFFTSSIVGLSFLFHMPTLDKKYSCEYRDLTEPLKLPGCVPLHGKDLMDPAQDRKNEAYSLLLHMSRSYKEAEGIFVNSFVDLEPGPIQALMEKEPDRPPIYPVGPLVQTGSVVGAGESECLRWLDGQPSGSVLFVCFGSGGTLSNVQLQELAFGLEMSEQRFLWVARSPHQEKANASFFSVRSAKDPLGFLPQGFLDRTQGVGLVVPSWAPQIPVLRHESTGGFLTHCGWNSTLESIVHGVPMIAWPLYAEQKINATILVEDLKLALRPTAGDHGTVGRQEIARVVKCLMEGEVGRRLRKRAMDLKDAGAKALAADGSSFRTLCEVAHMWKSSKEI